MLVRQVRQLSLREITLFRIQVRLFRSTIKISHCQVENQRLLQLVHTYHQLDTILAVY